MMLEPDYGDFVDAALDKIETDPSRKRLWNAISEAIDLVCDEPNSAAARREAVRLASGKIIWQVPIRCYTENDDWVLIWAPEGNLAVISYIGPRSYKSNY